VLATALVGCLLRISRVIKQIRRHLVSGFRCVRGTRGPSVLITSKCCAWKFIKMPTPSTAATSQRPRRRRRPHPHPRPHPLQPLRQLSPSSGDPARLQPVPPELKGRQFWRPLRLTASRP